VDIDYFGSKIRESPLAIGNLESMSMQTWCYIWQLLSHLVM